MGRALSRWAGNEAFADALITYRGAHGNTRTAFALDALFLRHGTCFGKALAAGLHLAGRATLHLEGLEISSLREMVLFFQTVECFRAKGTQTAPLLPIEEPGPIHHITDIEAIREHLAPFDQASLLIYVWKEGAATSHSLLVHFIKGRFIFYPGTGRRLYHYDSREQLLSHAAAQCARTLPSNTKGYLQIQQIRS